MTRCKCGHLSDAHSQTNGICRWRDCFCDGLDPDSEVTPPAPTEDDLALAAMAYELRHGPAPTEGITNAMLRQEYTPRPAPTEDDLYVVTRVRDHLEQTFGPDMAIANPKVPMLPENWQAIAEHIVSLARSAPITESDDAAQKGAS